MIGIDLTENCRIEKALEDPKFISKILSEEEIQYVSSFKNSIEHIAGFFSAKEAVMKALEDCKKIGLKDIEINHYSSGKPYVILKGEAKRVFEEKKYKSLEISISQTQNFATAICLIN